MEQLRFALTIVLFGFISAASAAAQGPMTVTPQVKVTFYSSGNTFLKLAGSRAAFVGKIFDNNRELALLARHRFVTFGLAPGSHVLSTNWWMTTGPAGGSHLTINLVAGHHYYISTQFEEVGFGGGTMIVQEVTCEDAQLAGNKTKPLEDKHLRPEGIATVMADSRFPPCPKD